MNITDINKFNRRLSGFGKEFGVNNPAYNYISAQLQKLALNDPRLLDPNNPNGLLTTRSIYDRSGHKLGEVIQIRPTNALNQQNTSAGKILNKIVSNVDDIPTPTEIKNVLKNAGVKPQDIIQRANELFSTANNLDALKDAFYQYAKENGGLTYEDNLLVAQAMDEYTPYREKRIEMILRAREFLEKQNKAGSDVPADSEKYDPRKIF